MIEKTVKEVKIIGRQDINLDSQLLDLLSADDFYYRTIKPFFNDAKETFII